MAIQLQRRTFTVDEYHQMIEAGILRDDERVELLSGEIVAMAPIGSRHFAAVSRLERILQRLLADRALISAGSAVTLRPDSEPQPDIGVYHLRNDFYESALPEPQGTYLIIEMSDTFLVIDRNLKIPRYARAGIPEVWLVDLQARHVEIYRSPSPEGYQDVRVASPGDRIAPAAFPDVVVLVDGIFS